MWAARYFLRYGNMSKIGKKPLLIPSGVEVKVDNSLVSVKGPKGELSKSIPSTVVMKIDGQELKISPLSKTKSRLVSIDWGLARALIGNLIKGVTEGFEKVLEFQGVGYKATIKGNQLELGLGFSHPVIIDAPEGISFRTEKNMIYISGISKELVGETAAKIRHLREPEPYKGSGIRYQNEVIIRKAGKKAATAG